MNFESKIGFDEIRRLLRTHCASNMGKERVDEMQFLTDLAAIQSRLDHTSEFKRLTETETTVPDMDFFDLRPCIQRIRLEGTFIEETEMHQLKRSLETLHGFIDIIRRPAEDSESPYPALTHLADGVFTFKTVTRRIDQILDKFGKVRDEASPALHDIRRQLASMEGAVGRTLNRILREAQEDGLVEKDASPTLRDGRLVIPVAPAMKRKLKGIVHDESATGKTVYIEPAEVVEANNRIRELEADERREIIRILQEFTDRIRQNIPELLRAFLFLADIEFVRAKSQLATQLGAVCPQVGPKPHIDWTLAVHPLLALSLKSKGGKVVPLDIRLDRKERILIISGPNAGGKSVCLKTVGLLQYMMQCGLPVPLGEHSKMGVFQRIMIDIGDEQSIDDDLSTYSSHLLNMKLMMRSCSPASLLLIDEFGGGTEPGIGGALAEAILRQFHNHGTFAVITTHYQNLKHFADNNEGVVNGAMLYDRHQMQPLFQLQIGNPGSSFAVEIARKIGIPEAVIKEASSIVGQEYIDADKYLQDIVRDKRYWEGKRQNIHQKEKQMENTISRYEEEVTDLHKQRKAIIREAKEEARRIISEANAQIERTIREIKEAEAERERTIEARQRLQEMQDRLAQEEALAAANAERSAAIDRKMMQILERRARKAKRKEAALHPAANAPQNATATAPYSAGQNSEQQTAAAPGEAGNSARGDAPAAFKKGAFVRMQGQTTIGQIEDIKGKKAVVVFGLVKTTVATDRLMPAEAPKRDTTPRVNTYLSRETREDIHQRSLNFHQDIDIRGLRADEALSQLTYYIDDAILVGANRVRILHGTGTGALRELTRQYLSTVSSVKSYRDEHVQFGGAGITIAEFY
ncbi:MAG: Smr/MutS family protein [Bacteroidales bacterium]|nr:Smr/MutS family protein [Candidatus Physcousia equi]